MNRYATSLFSDDIRTENNGKLIIIGAYQDQMMVPHFPIHLPKLCIGVSIYALTEEPIANLSIEIGYPGTGPFKFDFEVAEEGPLDLINLVDSSGNNIQCYRFQMETAGYPLFTQGSFSVKVVVDGVLVPCTGLDVVQQAPTQA